MAQLIINTKETDLVAQNNRARSLQALSDGFSNTALALMEEWARTPGVEQKIINNQGKIRLALGIKSK
ncbi:MAG: hypothetical protein F9K23_17045 [Bacteroidetes bacterium]|nr:MAG: hypothetical protein F9K23_17045 [Bacteroidota bacterium]